MDVDVHVIVVLLLVNIYVDANTRASFFTGARTCFFHDYLGLRRWSGCFSGGGSYRRRRLLTGGDPE